MRHTLPQTSPITCITGEPWSQYLLWREALAADGLLLVDFAFTPWWLRGADPLTLTALYCVENGALSVSVSDQMLEAEDALTPVQQYQRWTKQHKLFSAQPGNVLPLHPVFIAKPWGQEIWFTGVEERGVCCFGDDLARVPIPWLQAVLPAEYAGQGALVLLKILDPAAKEVTGDLYFELHQEKREVYVVTHVDREAWPDGTGYIRYGFDEGKLAEAGSEQAFRQFYHQAVSAYEAVRRQIDDIPSGSLVAESLLQQEAQLRRSMESYTHMRPLEVGDVVVVPLLMPHSLQHGVRTIEFQTPVYERMILSFAQRVLTQNHWDTGEAVAQMRLLPPAEEPFDGLPAQEGVRVERIVDFPDFEVRRMRIEPGAEAELALDSSYALAMIVEGELCVDGRNFGPEQAFFVPPGRRLGLIQSQPAQGLVLLLALPRI